MASGATNFNGQVSVPLDSHPNVLAAVLERGQPMLKPMLSPDITVIPITVMALTTAMVTDMLFPDIATLMSIVLVRGQLMLMPNLPIMVIPTDFTVILMDTDTMLMDPVSLDTPLVPLTFTEAPKVLASKNAIC